MKNYAFLISFVLFASNSFAQSCADEAFAMSPYDMKCKQFSSSCDVPNDWIRVSTCDLKKYSDGMQLPKEITSARDMAARLKAERNGKSPIESIQDRVDNTLNTNEARKRPSQSNGNSFFMGSSSNSFFNKED
jgi:hypothetical protein